MSDHYSDSQTQYLEALKDFMLANVKRGKVTLKGFRAPDEQEEDLIRCVRELLFMGETDNERSQDLLKLLYNISGPDLKDRGKFWISEEFQAGYRRLVHEHPVYWTEQHSHKEFRDLQTETLAYINRGFPAAISGDSFVWRRRITPGVHPMPDPKAAATGNPDVPQVYFIPGVNNYKPVDAADKVSLSSHPGMMGEFDFVSQWMKDRGPLDMHYIQQDPNLWLPDHNRTSDTMLSGNVQGFINRFILPDIAVRGADNTWRPLDPAQIKKNLSRHTFIGHCDGGKWIQKFEIELFSLMTDLGYEYNDIQETMSELAAVSVGYRPHQDEGATLIPTLSVCNTNDRIINGLRGAFDFSDSINRQKHSGIESAWMGKALHVESEHAPAERYFKDQSGALIKKPDAEHHDFRSYSQLGERVLHRGETRTLYRMHACAPLIRGVVDDLVVSSKEGVRDGAKIINERARTELSPTAIDASIAFLASQNTQLNNTRRGRPR